MPEKQSAPALDPPDFHPSWGPLMATVWFIVIVIVTSFPLFAAEDAGLITVSLPDGKLDFYAFSRIAAPLQILATLIVASRLRFNPLDVLALRYPARMRQLVIIVLALMAAALAIMIAVFVVQQVFEENGEVVPANKNQEDLAQIILKSGLLPSLMISGLLAPIAEETMFRGLLLLSYVNTRLWFWGAAVITSFLFALFHNPGTLNPFVQAPYFVMGLAFALALRWTGSLWVPIGMHMLKNVIAVFSLTFHWFD